MATEVIRITGLDRATQVFDQLATRAQKTIVRKAVRAGGSPLLKAIRRRCPRKNGLLKRTLVQLIRVYPASGTVLGVIGQDKTKSFHNARKKIKHSGGISGRGELTPIHLVDQPTKPHKIVPDRAKRLKLTSNGRLAWARLVAHPGTRGHRFLAAGAAEAEADHTREFTAKFQAEVLKAAVL